MASLSTYFLLPNLFNKILRISLVNHVRSVSEVLLSRVSKPENDCVVESVCYLSLQGFPQKY